MMRRARGVSWRADFFQADGMNVLLIDDDPDFRALMRVVLKRALPDARLSEYDPEGSGRPSDDFPWYDYDVILLDHHLGGGETGLRWMKMYGASPAFPSVILLTGSSDPYVVAAAMKAGVADYLNKQDLSANRIASMLEAVNNERKAIPQQAKGPAPAGEEESHGTFVYQTPSYRMEVPSVRGYRMRTRIGAGATSSVYLGERASDNQTLVLKVMHTHLGKEDRLVQRFSRESKISIELDSPHVVRIYDEGIDDGYIYIAMEFMPRGDLKQRIENGFNRADAVACMVNIALGLEVIHDAGLVHRDLKPANVMFRHDDSLAITDFGIAREINEASDLTMAGEIMGTPHYMSPEQALGENVGPRSDLYSAGAMFYELLTGQKPYKATNAQGIIYQHVHGDQPALPESLNEYQPILNRLMAKESARRYGNANELKEDLLRLNV